MPLPSWNHTWTARDVAGSTHGEIFVRYLAAFNERFATRAGVSALGGPSPGDEVLMATQFGAGGTVIPPGTGWGWLQSQIASLASFFVRKVAADGVTDYSPQGLYGIDSPLITIDDSGGLSWLPFPAPDGWTRKFPREIWKIAYPGSAGQRARFTFRGGTLWYSDLTTANPATTGWFSNVSTPIGERDNTGKYFDHNGVAWVLSTDQASDADVVTEHLVPRGTPPFNPPYGGSVYFPGDYWGPWCLNDLRDALNQLTILPARTVGVFPIENHLFVFDDSVRGLDNPNQDHSQSGSSIPGGTPADAQAAYAAAGPPTNGAYLTALEQWDGDAGSGYTFQAVSVSPRTCFQPGAVPSGAFPNPLGFKCELSFWGWAKANGVLFNAFGTPSLEQLWTEFGARVTTGITYSVYNTIGDVPAAAPAYPGESEGWIMGREYQAILADYEVTDGFQWTASTP